MCLVLSRVSLYDLIGGLGASFVQHVGQVSIYVDRAVHIDLGSVLQDLALLIIVDLGQQLHLGVGTDLLSGFNLVLPLLE